MVTLTPIIVSPALPATSPANAYPGQYFIVPNNKQSSQKDTVSNPKRKKHAKAWKVVLGLLGIIGLSATARVIKFRRLAHLRKNISTKEYEARIRQVLEKVYRQEKIPVNVMPKILVKSFSVAESPIQNVGPTAGYRGTIFHEIQLDPKKYQKATSSIDNLIAHEGFHSFQHILRSRLPVEERNRLVREHLISVIKQGQVYHHPSGKMHQLPEDLKAPFIEIISSSPFPKVQSEDQVLDTMDVLAKKLKAVRTFSIQPNKQKAISWAVAGHYAQALEPFSNHLSQTIGNLPPLTSEGQKLAFTSLQKSLEGKRKALTTPNGKISIFQYFGLWEEKQAYAYGRRFEIDQLKEALADMKRGEPNPFPAHMGLQNSRAIYYRLLKLKITQLLLDRRLG